MREIALTALMLVVTLGASALLARDIAATISAETGDATQVARLWLFAMVVGLMIYGNLVYLVTRIGYYTRRARHRTESFEQLVADHWASARPIAVLVPSYKEDARTIRQTLLSAALQHYPNKRVVLLVDDPPLPRDLDSSRLLAAARRMPAEITALLREPRRIVQRGMDAFRARRQHGGDLHDGLRELLDVHEALVAWMDGRITLEHPGDHTDAHFLAVTYRAHQALLRESARRAISDFAAGTLTEEGIDRAFGRLEAVFAVEISTFERKRYQNLSQDPSKAANLNTFIGLLGRSVRERRHADGLHLEVVERGDDAGAVAMPDADFVLTLDADSMLTPDYALRLATVLAAPGNERVAVVQTPYTAIPGAPGALERIAGATTDLQYIVHQGFTWCHATFWVGANALLRKEALEDIRIDAIERGYRVTKYIQDRTVIEDTESTVDLAARGWTLHNYPERLAFSATPPDFGSLLIQRRRWANGGLLIIPKLARNLQQRPFAPISIPSFLVRLHYLSSIATSSVGMLILLALPIEVEPYAPWLGLLAVAYAATYWRDLVQSGYLPGDLLRVVAFNVMLLPVNLVGVLKSLRQGITGTRTPFGRTPKVAGRTAAPAWAVLSLWVLLAWCALSGAMHLVVGRWLQAGFSLGIAVALLYAVTAFVGTRASWEDITRPLPFDTRQLSTRT